MRRWWTLARRPDIPDTTDRGLKFSVLGLLILTSAVALVLTLVHASRAEGDRARQIEYGWPWIASNILGYGSFFVNTVCAAHAVLRPGGVRRNILLVLLISALVGLAVAFATGQSALGWSWIVIGGAAIGVVPTVVVISTLLVVRSCGYRLLRPADLPSELTPPGAMPTARRGHALMCSGSSFQADRP
jgi:hypothetical protein